MKLKQISRRTVSVVLAVLMVLSTLLVGSISTVNAANNGDTLYLWNYKESDFNSATAVKMDYDSTNSVYTTTVDVKSTSSWQWWCLFVSTSSSAKTPLWSKFPTYDKTNATRINGVEPQNRDDINVIHYQSNDNVLNSATTGYVKITYSLTDNKITFSDAESTGGGETKPTYYYRGAQNEWKATALTVSDDKTYCYYDKLSAGSSTSNLFKITYSDSDWTTLKDKIDTTKGNVTIKFENDKSDAAWYVESDAYLIVEYNNGTPIVYASTTLPGTTATYTGITVSANPSEGGSVTVSSGSVTAGSSVDVNATASAGYTFSGWSSDNGTFGDSTSANTTFTPTANNAVAVANFTSTTPATTAKVYLKNTANWGNTLKAYAWSGSGNTTTKYLGDFPGTAMTKVKDDIYSIDVNTKATNILFTNKNDGSNQSTDLSLTGVAIDGKTYDFSSTELIYDNKDNKWSLYNTVKSNITIDAAIVNGRITKVDPQNNVESGTTVKVTVEPNEGYECSNVTYNGTPATKDSNNVYTFAMPAKDVTVSATFTEKAATPERNLYVAGRFAVKDANGTVYKTADGNGWNETCTNDKLKFQRVGTSNIYKLETGYTIQEIVTNAAGFDDSSLYIRFYDKDKDKKYAPSTTTALTASDAGADKAKDTALDGGQSFWFTGNETSYVTLYLDASTDAPKFYFELSESNNFSVTMTQGISNFGGSLKGNSGFDENSTSATDVTKMFDKENNLTVQFYTQMKDTFDYNGDTRYKFGVQGYSILMTTSEGTQVTSQVTSTVNVAHPSSGVYTASYTFPENIISATVTPVFTVSEVYAESQGITFTTVYLRYQPNSGTTFKTYEPKYYTWRSNDSTASTTIIDGKEFENQPESGYPGQNLLYIGNNTYTVKVQSQIKGILFSYGNGDVQTFDYNEFLKLQELGYDNITFEIKEGSSETVAKAISDAFKGNGNTVYSTPGDVSGIVNDTNLSDEFFLDTNIEGYVIDVFGNKLLDTNGQPIRLTDLTGATNAAKLAELLEKMGKSTENGAITALYGARYGDGKIYGTEGSEGYGANTYYGMDYPIRVYYFNNLKQLISQQISGYGPIEGAASLEAGKTNREVYTFTWKYYEGTNASSVEKTFSSEFNVIPDDYKGVPYLVSYKTPLTTNKTRVAGKWYYQRDIAQFNVTVKPALMTNGVIDFNNTDGGTATVNGVETAVVNQGDTPTFEATNKTGYTFVGFYNADGTECYGTSNPFSGHKIANNETVYAVFKKLDVGTLKINNYVYQGTNLDPIPGGGTGNVSAKLYILRYDSDAKTYAADWEVYTNGEATINDMDKYYYVLSGTPLGADKFIAFRAKEVNEETGYVTYAKLDTLDGQPVYDESTNTYTYTSEQVVWDWETAVGTGEHTYTIDRYTDFQKVDVYATLNYHYKDRFGKDKLYVVRVRLTNAEIADDYKPSDDTITANAPYINDLFKDCTWKVTDTTLVTKTESRAEITADHSNATFDTLVDSVNGTTSKLDLPYDTLIQLTTDKVSGDKTFSYWKQYDLDSDGNVVADSGVIFSYNREVSVRVTFDRKFVAVYGESKELFTTNIQDAVYTREQSTNADGTVKYDYVYSDFLTQFETSIAGKTFADVAKNGDTKSGVKNVRFGIITEYDYKQAAYTGGDLTSYKSQAKKDTVTSTIITLDSNKKDSLASGWSNSTVKEDAEYNYYYNLYDLSGSVDDLTDLGRKDFFFKFENTAENQGKVYNVYSYVIYEDTTGTHVVLSTPKFMSIYATGTTNTPVVG